MAKSVKEVFGNDKTSLSVLKELAENSFDSVFITDASKTSKIL